MKRSIMLLVSIAVLTCISVKVARANDCDVKRVFRLDNDIPDITVVTTDGDTKELRELVEAFVVPAKIPIGVYNVNVRRKGSNLYEIKGKDLQVETRYCYEYAYGEAAVLKITSTSGGSVGKLVFEK